MLLELCKYIIRYMSDFLLNFPTNRSHGGADKLIE